MESEGISTPPNKGNKYSDDDWKSFNIHNKK